MDGYENWKPPLPTVDTCHHVEYTYLVFIYDTLYVMPHLERITLIFAILKP